MRKVLLLLLCSVVSLAISYQVAYQLAGHFFFDKFFLYKDVHFGYFPHGETYENKVYGKRGQDLVALKNKSEKNQADQSGQVLGTQNDADEFVVAVIGDSYVWGLGVPFEKSFTQVLEKKLNTIRKTKVLALGVPGDSVLDYYIRYKKVSQTEHVDMYVFSLVFNDALLLYRGQEVQDYYKGVEPYEVCQSRFPSEKALDDRKWNEIDFLILNDQAWQNPFNMCIVDESLQRLPTDDTLYFMTENYTYYKNIKIWEDIYSASLQKARKNVLFASEMRKNTPYKEISETHSTAFRVSDKELHPSELAHQMYADSLFQEITTNPKWNFQK